MSRGHGCSLWSAAKRFHYATKAVTGVGEGIFGAKGNPRGRRSWPPASRTHCYRVKLRGSGKWPHPLPCFSMFQKEACEQAFASSEERRVGKTCVRTDRTRWTQYH